MHTILLLDPILSAILARERKRATDGLSSGLGFIFWVPVTR